METKIKIISNFETFSKQILEQNKSKIAGLNPSYKILKTIDIENYFYSNLDKFEIKSVELLKNQLSISKNLTQVIIKYKQENKTLLQFQDINFECQTAKLDLMKIFIQFEKFKNKNKFIDIEDIYQILFDHFSKNQKSLEELFDYTNKFKISKLYSNKLNKNQKQLLELLKIQTLSNVSSVNSLEISDPLSSENQKEETTNCENLIIESKNQNSQNSFILEKISDLKEKENPQTCFGIITNTIENKINLQNYLTSYDIKLENFSSKNLLQENIIKYLSNILSVIQNPKGANNECFYILDKLNIREETKRKITRKASRAEKSIFKVLTNQEESKDTFSDFEDENNLITQLRTNLINLNELKSSGTNITNLILNTIKTFKFYENLITNEKNIQNKNQIFCLNEFLNLTKHFENLYKTNSLEKFLNYLTNLEELEYTFQVSTNNLTNITILIASEFDTQNNLHKFDYLFFTELNHTKYPIFQIKNLFDNQTQDTRELDFIKQQIKFNQIISTTKNKNYIIYNTKNLNGISQKKSKILNTPEFDYIESKPYTKEIEIFKLSSADKQKQTSIKKINELILDDKFDLAKSELEILKLTFGKKDLTSFMSKHTAHEIAGDVMNDIDTSKLVYSVSQLQTYESCPKKYMYNYIYKIPSRPRHYFDFGTSVHEALEFLSGDFDKKLPTEKLYILGVKYLTDGWISKGYDNAKQEQEYFEKGLNIIKEFIVKETELRKQNRQTVGLELKFFLDFEGRKLMGYIDRIDKVDGEIEILDYKTSKSMSRESDLEKNMQLLVYSLASEAHQDIKKFPTSVGLWYVLHDKIVKISPKKEHTIEIKKRVIEQIKKIENKNFKPIPTKFGCTYCDFNQICNDSIADKILK